MCIRDRNISAIYFIGIATKPIAVPSGVNGTNIANKETIIDDIYTCLLYTSRCV